VTEADRSGRGIAFVHRKVDDPHESIDRFAAESELGRQSASITAHRAAGRIEAGALGIRSIQETPFSVGHADAEQIARVAATTIEGARTYDASISGPRGTT
jgi:hypothetical protein